MGVTEPIVQDPVLSNAIEHPIGPDDGGVHCPGQNQSTHAYDKCCHRQLQTGRPHKVHD